MISNFVVLIFLVSICRCDGFANSEVHTRESHQSSLRENGRLLSKQLFTSPLSSDQCVKKERFAVDPMNQQGILNKLNSRVCRPSLHLRGGFFENIGSLCSCFNVCDSEVAANDENDQTKKRRVGRMAQSVEVNANLQKVYQVVSDIEHYRDWSGDGLRSIKILENGRGYAVAEYVCGTFGFTFHFSLYWGLLSPGIT
jgi:hypothetical protein